METRSHTQYQTASMDGSTTPCILVIAMAHAFSSRVGHTTIVLRRVTSEQSNCEEEGGGMYGVIFASQHPPLWVTQEWRGDLYSFEANAAPRGNSNKS